MSIIEGFHRNIHNVSITCILPGDVLVVVDQHVEDLQERRLTAIDIQSSIVLASRNL